MRSFFTALLAAFLTARRESKLRSRVRLRIFFLYFAQSRCSSQLYHISSFKQLMFMFSTTAGAADRPSLSPSLSAYSLTAVGAPRDIYITDTHSYSYAHIQAVVGLSGCRRVRPQPAALRYAVTLLFIFAVALPLAARQLFFAAALFTVCVSMYVYAFAKREVHFKSADSG